MAKQKLDLTRSYQKQDEKEVKKLCSEMLKDKNWPKLKEYADCWPVHCFLMMQLKNSSAAARRREMKTTHVRMQAVMNRRGMSPVDD
ncbi:hypothetical protein DXG01_001082 [Tephrocybe rancida]|nr:hypothetical protein DXG01_001082 [Tephrocybe rancida]